MRWQESHCTMVSLRITALNTIGRSRTWQTTQAEPDPRNPTASIGIYDIKSGSDQARQLDRIGKE
jgi:hypothetical protein